MQAGRRRGLPRRRGAFLRLRIPTVARGLARTQAMACLSEGAVQMASAEPVWDSWKDPHRHSLSPLPRVGLWALTLLGVFQYFPHGVLR